LKNGANKKEEIKQEEEQVDQQPEPNINIRHAGISRAVKFFLEWLSEKGINW
jgi:hypothetical protein